MRSLSTFYRFLSAHRHPHSNPQPGALISGRSDSDQRQLLKEVFLEADSEISTDEGCTATVVLVQEGPEKDLMFQVGLNNNRSD